MKQQGYQVLAMSPSSSPMQVAAAAGTTSNRVAINITPTKDGRAARLEIKEIQEDPYQDLEPGNSPSNELRFLKGVAISVWQNSPDTASHWTAFARSHGHDGSKGGKRKGLLSRLVRRAPSPEYDISNSPDFWNKYSDDIASAKALGCTSMRLSLEWSRVMPAGPGQVDGAAVARYHNILDELEAAGLVPMVTLHHFVHPHWFEQLGGFAVEANIRHFADWAATAFTLFGGPRHPSITLWATFNEPTCVAFTGYIVGIHAPGKRGRIREAGAVLLHMLRAHTAAYAAIRALPHSACARVGLVHQHIRFEAKGRGPLHAASDWTASWLTHCFGWDVVHDWLRTGAFSWRLPGAKGGAGLTSREPGGRPPCDWIGINYYTRVVLDWHMGFSCRPGEVMTDMGWPVVPQGLYDSIVHASALGLPIYITETGLADGRDDRRAALVDQYWDQVARAVADGYDVRGLYWWTLVDNYEWHKGYTMKFGLYEWTGLARSAGAGAGAACANGTGGSAPSCAEATELPGAAHLVSVGGSAAATATATITSVVLHPHGQGPTERQAKTDVEASPSGFSEVFLLEPGTGSDPLLLGKGGMCTASAAGREAVTHGSAGAFRTWDLADVGPSMVAVEVAQAKAGQWDGRRLRHGALALVWRYTLLPDALPAARDMLVHMARAARREESQVRLAAVTAQNEVAHAGSGSLGTAAGVIGAVVRSAGRVIGLPWAMVQLAWRMLSGAVCRGPCAAQPL